jgi:hypothetical protein
VKKGIVLNCWMFCYEDLNLLLQPGRPLWRHNKYSAILDKKTMTLQFLIIKSLHPETEPDPAPDPDPKMLDPHRNQCGSSTSVTISVQYMRHNSFVAWGLR